MLHPLPDPGERGDGDGVGLPLPPEEPVDGVVCVLFGQDLVETLPRLARKCVVLFRLAPVLVHPDVDAREDEYEE